MTYSMRRPFADEFPTLPGLCPTARFVGGVSEYLCECTEPRECPGVVAQLGCPAHQESTVDPCPMCGRVEPAR